jgi:hypothetical protein
MIIELLLLLAVPFASVAQPLEPVGRLTSCLKSEPSVCVSAEGLSSPLTRGAQSFSIVSSVPVEQISLEALWEQPDLRIVSVPRSIARVNSQSFSIDQLIFVIEGPWSIDVTITRAGKTDSISIPVIVEP